MAFNDLTCPTLTDMNDGVETHSPHFSKLGEKYGLDDGTGFTPAEIALMREGVKCGPLDHKLLNTYFHFLHRDIDNVCASIPNSLQARLGVRQTGNFYELGFNNILLDNGFAENDRLAWADVSEGGTEWVHKQMQLSALRDWIGGGVQLLNSPKLIRLEDIKAPINGEASFPYTINLNSLSGVSVPTGAKGAIVQGQCILSSPNIGSPQAGGVSFAIRVFVEGDIISQADSNMGYQDDTNFNDAFVLANTLPSLNYSWEIPFWDGNIGSGHTERVALYLKGFFF